MDLELRDTTLPDLVRLAPLVSPFQCDPSQREALIAMWSEIVKSKCGVLPLAAEPKAPFTIVHFACGVFVSDERANEYHDCRQPFIARRLLAQWVAGERPFLNAQEVARANVSPGLNLVMTHYGGRRDDPRADIANYESSRRALRGWNLRTYTAELSLDPPRDNREWGRSLGYRVLEYSPDRLRADGIAESQAPFIWAATRLDAESNPGYAMALLFRSFAAPRLGFTRLEQHLLSLALDGATDASIARAADFSESAVKKHFRRLYEKARAIGVLALAADEGPAQPTRGVELRRHLLSYLREHPEELRPYAGREKTPSAVATVT
jgi:DNA-binding CsgD family transcriptional regulator